MIGLRGLWGAFRALAAALDAWERRTWQRRGGPLLRFPPACLEPLFFGGPRLSRAELEARARRDELDRTVDLRSVLD